MAKIFSKPSSRFVGTVFFSYLDNQCLFNGLDDPAFAGLSALPSKLARYQIKKPSQLRWEGLVPQTGSFSNHFVSDLQRLVELST